MRRWLYGAALVGALTGLGYWGWQVFFPSPEKVIRKRLGEIARLASFGPNEAPLAKLANSQKLLSFFSPNIEVALDFGGRVRSISGRDDLSEAVMGVRGHLAGLSVRFPDIVVAVAEDRRSAAANVTVRAKVHGEKDDYVDELKLLFRPEDGDWLIFRIEPVKTLL
jgi:hypothetical protein